MFSEESIPHFQFSIQAYVVSLSLISPLIPLCCSSNGWDSTPDWSQKEQYPNFSSPNAWSPRPALSFVQSLLSQFFLLSRPIQLSDQGFCGDVACLSPFAQRFSLDLSSPLNCFTIYVRTSPPWCQYDAQQSHGPPTVSWGQSLMHLVSIKWEPCLLPDAGCCLKLQNVEAN